MSGGRGVVLPRPLSWRMPVGCVPEWYLVVSGVNVELRAVVCVTIGVGVSAVVTISLLSSHLVFVA